MVQYLRAVSVLVMAPLAVLTPSVLYGQPEAIDEIELLRSERRAKAHGVVHVIPIYSIAGSDETSLYLLNLFADPLEVDVAAMSAAGTPFPLGRMTVEPTQHARLDLRQALAGAGASRHRRARVSSLQEHLLHELVRW